MLHIHILQNMDNQSDLCLEEKFLASSYYRRFRWLSSIRVPDEATILRERAVLMQQGTSVDSTLIDAPSSTKNKEKERDREMHSTRKRKNWRFVKKAHMGVDRGDSGMVYSLAMTFSNAWV